MKRIPALYLAAALLIIFACNFGCNEEKPKGQDITISPDAGTTVKAGTDVTVKVKYPAEMVPDSIVYLLESTTIASKKDALPVIIKTDTIPMGPKAITAKVYKQGVSQDVSTNIVVLAAKAPEQLTFKVEKVFPHDVESYTEGLQYVDGYLYESDGGYLDPPPNESIVGPSSLRKVDVATGKVLLSVQNDPKVFAEGLAVVGDKIIQLTWKEKIGYVYDKNTFKLLNTFNNNVGVEGWGMTLDGEKLYMDDSTNRIWFLDKETYQQKGFIDVYDDKGPVDDINELEYVDGKIYANVFQKDTIIVIDPKTGAVLQIANMAGLYPKRNKEADVLNGIAWDAKGKRMFITGKFWDKLFQVSFSRK
ncbi:glutaminyl-peptide cyclotransferase [Mucilaginibacter calamicampi]|uniref:Glutaminyl-peptide cyclotransferase n=1 Tax=Mucilaginibacter calamicampi TaxID=1302352 RepID=A0ABW2YQK5_9SPHI